MKVKGIWVPLVTPFHNGAVDFLSYRRLIEHYLRFEIDGFIPLGTTGECPTIDEYEFEEILEKTIEYTNSCIPVFAGVGGNDTRKVVKSLKIAEKIGVQGILSVCPYYNRPDQRGIYEHFKLISETTPLDIIVYNIPYRTGTNIENETIVKLSELNNIVALKDCSGNIKQTLSLLAAPPSNFSIMTGEDSLFYTTLVHGGQGGILASAHLNTQKFIDIYKLVNENNHEMAYETWSNMSGIIPLLFNEPNPAPIKYCLEKLGLIESCEVRLPLVVASEALRKILDSHIEELSPFVSPSNT